jgi:uncharacterized protein (TIGR02453 family)
MWPPEALEFLRELEANNDRDWFKANRGRYEECLLAPARELADKLSDLGEPHYFRPYNNTRFRPGPPLKEHIALAFGYAGAGGFYLNLSLDGLVTAAGMHDPAPDQLERFRAAIVDDRKARSFERAVATADSAGLSLPEPQLKRAPRGYPMDHPRLDRLRLKRITVHRHRELGPWLHEPTCDELIRADLDAARLLVEWLADTVGPSRPAGYARRQPADGPARRSSSDGS